eukprot:scaffold25511_cov60-Phaeocystis_antarctica.AAC.1
MAPRSWHGAAKKMASRIKVGLMGRGRPTGRVVAGWRDNKTADPPLLASVRHAAHLAAAPPLYGPPLVPGLSCAFRLRRGRFQQHHGTWGISAPG